VSAATALFLIAAWTAVAQPSLTAAPTAADRGDVLRGAISDARSNDPARHEHLLEKLRNRRFLETLDSPTAYLNASKLGLNVTQVLDTLARNTAPSAQAAFLALTVDPVFLAHDERIIALIVASAAVRPAPPSLVRFWDRHSRPNDGFTPTTISALVANGDIAAIALLAKKLLDPAHADDEKISWMRTDILTHRNDLALLQACDQLLRGKQFRKNLRPPLVEVLFDYRPGEWFKPASSYSAPPLESASAAARTELQAIGELALRTVALSPSQREAVRLKLQHINKLANRSRADAY
jgi:hypothetical protein